MKSKKIQSYLLLLLINVIWGTTFVVVKGAVSQVSPFFFVTARYLMAGLVFLPFALFYHIRHKIRPSAKEWWGMFWAVNLGMIIHAMLQYSGLRFSSATNGAVLVSLSPLLVMAFNVRFKKQKLTTLQILGTVCSLVGIYALVRPVFTLTSQKFLGDLMFLGTAFTWASYSLICAGLLKRLPAFYVAAVIGVMAGLESGILMVPFGFWRQVWMFSTSIWIAIAYLAIFSSFFCYIFWNKGLEELGSTNTSHFLFVIPVVSAISSAIFLHERPDGVEIAGAILILCGVWMVNRFEYLAPLQEKNSHGDDPS